MADNTTINAGSGGDVIASDDLTTLNGGAVSGVKAQRVKVGYGADASFTDVSGTNPLPVTGGSLAATTGAITTTTTTVSAATPTAGNATISISGTHSGVNVSFEASDDSGTTWYPISMVREDSGVAETTSGVLPANTARIWTTGVPGFTNLRVRATAWTSGSASVRITQGTFPFENQVAAVVQAPTKTLFSAVTAEAGIAPTASSALQTLQVARSGGSASALTSIAITAGKTLRIQSMTLTVAASTTTAIRAIANIRYNPTGATSVTSAAIAEIGAASPAATALSTGFSDTTFADGLDLYGGTAGTFGVTIIGSSATGLAWVSITGYEF